MRLYILTKYYLIRNIMKNYPNKFKKIKLSMNNIHEIDLKYINSLTVLYCFEIS